MPEIADLSCAEMAEVLERIDASGYRGRDLVPEGHPDHPLFLYEDRLAAAIYTGCTIRASRRAAPTGVFRHGFGPD